MSDSSIAYPDKGRQSFVDKVAAGRSGASRRLWLFWALLGPGIISMLANNDAGGMISYTMTGAKFGIACFCRCSSC